MFNRNKSKKSSNRANAFVADEKASLAERVANLEAWCANESSWALAGRAEDARARKFSEGLERTKEKNATREALRGRVWDSLKLPSVGEIGLSDAFDALTSPLELEGTGTLPAMTKGEASAVLARMEPRTFVTMSGGGPATTEHFTKERIAGYVYQRALKHFNL